MVCHIASNFWKLLYTTNHHSCIFMARASSSKPRASKGGQRRRAAGPQIVAVAPGMSGLGSGEVAAGEAVGGAPVGGGAASGAAGVAGLEDRSYGTYPTYEPHATAGNEADALADGGCSHDAGTDAGVALAKETGAKAGLWLPPALRRWLERARALGLREEELVFELHVRLGLPLLEVARVLGLGAERVLELWARGRALRAARAPQCETDFSGLREHLCAVLWQTVEETFPSLLHEPDDDESAADSRASAPMLSVRLKALDQIAKLYDVGLVQHTAGFSPLPYSTPDDIADDVRQRVLEMHGRG